MHHCNIVNKPTVSNLFHEEYEKFQLEANENFSSFMKRVTEKYSQMFTIFCESCFIPPSSISSERVFSSLGDVITKKRTTLNYERTCKIIKLNRFFKKTK